jgi:hypothetical protein
VPTSVEPEDAVIGHWSLVRPKTKGPKTQRPRTKDPLDLRGERGIRRVEKGAEGVTKKRQTARKRRTRPAVPDIIEEPLRVIGEPPRTRAKRRKAAARTRRQKTGG